MDAAIATGVAVVPDKLIFDGGEERFRIINPNTAELEFAIESDIISCTPEEGAISPKESIEISCSAESSDPESTQILVQTALADDGGVSMIPAVAIKAEIASEKIEEQPSDNQARNSIPLRVEGGPSPAEPMPENQTTTRKMTPEIILIAALVAAIASILTYSEAKKIIEKKKEISGCAASSTQDSPAGQSSAEASTSPGQQQQAPSHGETAGNQQLSPPELSP